MAHRVSQPALVFGPLAVALWPVWLWWGQRTAPPADRLCGALALATAVAFFLSQAPADAPRLPLRSAAGLLAVYAVGAILLPQVLAVLLAVFVVAAIGSVYRYGVPLHLGTCGLLLLSLPVASRMQFYLGYPLRVGSGAVAAWLLRAAGYAVERHGTVLHWDGQWVAIDAPCSGAKMLWAGAYLVCTLACFYGLAARRTLLAGCVAAVAILAGNALRTASLFILENSPVPTAAWWHGAVGGVSFAATAMLVVAAMRWIARRGKCEAPPSCDAALCGGDPARWRAMYLVLCVAAAVAPLGRSLPPPADLSQFPGWPSLYGGRPLEPVELDPHERDFAAGLPGRLGKFSDGARQYMIQWIAEGNRLLHPATECMVHAGFTITPQPLWIDGEGHRWSCSLAERGPQRVRVLERIFSDAGESWQDVSAWYWAALLGKTRGPWWAITILEPAAPQTE